MRVVVVNADDFGLTKGVNRGIIEAHEKGIVTSASLMVRYATAQDAAELARAHPRLSVGLHFDAGEWRFADGAWKASYEVIDSSDAAAVQRELEQQLATFEQLIGAPPTHLDSHQHVHLAEPARSVLLEQTQRLGIPLRSCTAELAYVGGFYGQTGEGEAFPEGISGASLVRLIKGLAPGWTELGCHPGYAEGLDSVYKTEREEELRVLSSAEVRAALRLSQVQLRSFHDWPK